MGRQGIWSKDTLSLGSKLRTPTSYPSSTKYSLHKSLSYDPLSTFYQSLQLQCFAAYEL